MNEIKIQINNLTTNGDAESMRVKKEREKGIYTYREKASKRERLKGTKRENGEAIKRERKNGKRRKGGSEKSRTEKWRKGKVR